MTFINIVSVMLWLANTACWAFYAHSKWMALASVAGVIVSIFAVHASRVDYWAHAAKRRHK